MDANWKIWVEADKEVSKIWAISPTKQIYQKQSANDSLLHEISLLTGCKPEARFLNIDLCLFSLLERNGSPEANPTKILITTKGISCLVESRRNAGQIAWELEFPGYNQIIEVEESIDSSGRIVEPLAESEINRVLRCIFQTKKNNIILVALTNSYRNPVHEKTLHNLLLTAGYQNIHVSHLSEQAVSFAK
jgi:hypothetical protein